MLHESASPTPTRGHRVRELVCAYRPFRDGDGRVVDVPTVILKDARTAAAVLAPLIADQPVEVFAVACLSTKNRLLAWHVLSRGTRASTPVSMPDVFVPACLTPGTTGLMVVHNHPSGDPTPSPDARGSRCDCAPPPTCSTCHCSITSSSATSTGTTASMKPG